MMNILQTIILFTVINLLGTGLSGPKVKIDKELKPFVNTFLEEARKRDFQLDLGELTVNLSDEIPQDLTDVEKEEKATVIGVCYTSSYAPPAIEISRTFWKNANYYSRESILFHELGHCLLHRVHDDDEMKMGKTIVPMSVMNSFAPKGEVYKFFRNYYLDELFQNTNLDVVISSYHPKGKNKDCPLPMLCPSFPVE